jgi:ribonucleoside-diphosphate reductase subunit M1
MKTATHANMTSMHFYGWKQGLKTGMYYLRTRPAADAIKFTVDTGVLSSVSAPIKDKENMGGKMAKAPAYVSPMVKKSIDKAPVETSKVDAGKSLIERIVGISLEDQALACSIENPGACDMCSG